MAPVELAKWECHKLECLADFIRLYDKGVKEEGCYLDLFARAEQYVCRDTDLATEGIEMRVLHDPAPFQKYIFVTKNQAEAEKLADMAGKPRAGTDACFIGGNTMRDTVMRRIFELVPRTSPTFALLDPRGYSALRWSVIGKLAAHGVDWHGHKPDLLIVFPLEMALLRNLARQECENSINRLFGHNRWQSVKQQRAQAGSSPDSIRRELIALFTASLKGLAYRHVEDIEPARYSNPPYYHLIWASDRAGQLDLLKQVWSGERYLPGELFHGSDNAWQ
jgi:three-Cys-motif partner protein